MPTPPSITAGDASKGVASVLRALRDELGRDVGLQAYAVAPETGIGLVVQPGHARIEHSRPDALPSGDEALQVNLDVSIAIVSSGVSGADGDDPFLDEAVESSVALALACRDPRTIEVSGSTATLHSLTPEGRPGIRQVADQPDSFECRWAGVLTFSAVATPILGTADGRPLFDGVAPVGDEVEVHL